MNRPFLRPSLVEGGIVNGFPITIDHNTIKVLRHQIRDEIDTFVDHISGAILAQDDPLLAIFRVGLLKFTTDLRLEGLENIHSGRTVVVCNHPFPFVDDFALMLSVINLNRARPWAFVGNTNSITHYFPNWRSDKRFSHRIIPVRRIDDDSFAEVTNGTEVVEAATQFLIKHEDAILFIAADGSNSIFQDRIAQPYAGFAKIARSSRSDIVPVLFTGTADMEKLTFEVYGKIFPSIQTQGETSIPEIIDSWCKILQHELESRKER